jgi:tetratricopeptide (TPR) repeat protein
MSNENIADVQNLVQAGEVHGGVHFHHRHAEPAPPEQLPPDPAIFVDRQDEQERLQSLLVQDEGARAACAVISGLSGTGKSALATRWVHGVRSRFEHGQIYLDLHGREPAVSDVAEHCLRALGVSGEQLPRTPGEALGLLRTRTTGRKLIFVFDNVAEPRVLLDLRPASADSLVLFISHRSARELGLDGVESIELGTLDEVPALELLAAACGPDRVREEPEAARRLVELCDGLPIALRIVAGRLARHRKWSLARVADELSDEDRRLDRLHDRGEPVVREALDFSFGHLPEPQAHLYRLLGLFPGPAFTPEAVAALAGMSWHDTEDVLSELHATSLLEENDQGQYRFHDLVRLHAVELAKGLPAGTEEAALSRLAEWYRKQGAFADRALMEPSRLRVGRDDDLVASAENPFDPVGALQWLESERQNILAVVEESADRGWNRTVISLCDGPLWALHNQHKHYADTLNALNRATSAAQVEEDLVAEARMRTLRVRLLMESHEFEAAHEEADTARRVAEASAHRRILGSALEFHGRVYLEQHRPTEALPLFQQAHAINAERGRPRGMALQEHFMGQALDMRGDYEEALRHLRKALERLAEFPNDKRTPARIRVSMGRTYQHLGWHREAIDVLGSAIEGMRARQVSFDLAQPLVLLADSLDAVGDADAAREHREEALRIYEQAQSPEAESLRERLR